MKRLIGLVVEILLGLLALTVGGIILTGFGWLIFLRGEGVPEWFGILWVITVGAVLAGFAIFGIVKGAAAIKERVLHERTKRRNNLICTEQGHDWNGCRCRRCGNQRNENHDWVMRICPACGGTGFLPYVDCGLSYGDPDYGNPDPQGPPCGCDRQKWLQCTICGQEKEL
jgi:hypothetical protein